MGPGDRREQRRLAGAVGADQRHHLALVHRQRDVAHGLEQAVAHLERLDLKQAHAAAVPR